MSAGRPAFRHLAWVGLAVVLALALAVGAHRGGGRAGPVQRAAAIDADLRCPSCEGIDVLQSSASTAVAIRHTVAARVRAGQSDAQIEAFLVSRYGPSVLLRPATSGAEGLVWLVPVVAGALALGALAVLFWRRRRTARTTVSAADEAIVRHALEHDAPRVPREPAASTPRGAP